MAVPSSTLHPQPCRTEAWNGWKWARYLYFMRFSILLWLVFPAFIWLDGTGLSAMTRGIVALEYRQDAFFAAFFITAAGWVALLSARIVCAYGQERFDAPPPAGLTIANQMSVSVFWGAQIPGFSLLGYVWYRTISEQGRTGPALSQFDIGISMVLGVLAALTCWMLMGAIYYWMFWQTGKKNPAKAFVVPYTRIVRMLETRAPSAPLLGLLLLFEQVTRFGEGYCDPERGDFRLHSGHAFASLTLGFLAAVYLAFWDLTAPVELPTVRLLVIVIFLIAFVSWAFLTLRATKHHGASLDLGKTVGLFVPLLLVVLIPFVTGNRPNAMPVLASVTVLLTFVLWGLAGMAFFLDRFRVPVTIPLLIFFLLTSWAVPDHHLTSSNPPQNLDLLTPAQVLARFEAGTTETHPRPAIIVTATGGGIHAAAWTSAVLAKIEESTKQEQKTNQPGFHDSIVLLSTVSGGSVGATPWLSNYVNGTFGRTARDGSTSWEQVASQCSDLRAVAWGLTYADFLRLLLPIRLSWIGKEINQYDRGWALEQAFWRNRQTDCAPDKLDNSKKDKNLSDFRIPNDHTKWLPAFSLNTTTAELGSRYLVGNYTITSFKKGLCTYKEKNEKGDKWELPPPLPSRNHSEIVPAESVLECLQQDLPLSTGARLSANFPYVSPMSSLAPPSLSFHFGDGGYFDNDGTSTAMEFLWFALNPENQPLKKQETTPAGQPQSKLPVLLLEIRDGDDPPFEGEAAPKVKSWGPVDQAGGPLETFYKAGHSSVTLRNRRELTFLEEALRDKAEITHIVVSYLPAKKESGKDDSYTGAQPLSWHLTGQQKDDIRGALDRGYTPCAMSEVGRWLSDPHYKFPNCALEGANENQLAQ